jgi:hypothetical protein
MMDLLEKDDMPNKLSFHQEVKNLEFKETIDGIDMAQRVAMLIARVKKYLKNIRSHLKRIMWKIRLRRKVTVGGHSQESYYSHPEALSQEEIDQLLAPIDIKDTKTRKKR